MERFELAVALVRQAGAALRQARLEADAVRCKTGHQDLVTVWDKKTEQFLRQGILNEFPADAIVGEEFPAAGDASPETVWYIDPIDGTTNFINQHRNYAVSVGCWQRGEPLFGLVLDVENDRLYHARAGQGAWCGERRIETSRRKNIPELLLFTPDVIRTFLEPGRDELLRLARDVRAVRSIGSVALEICAVACGEADLCVALRSCPWDHNAARVILTEAGGAVAAASGKPLPLNEPCAVLATGSTEALELVLERYGRYEAPQQ